MSRPRSSRTRSTRRPAPDVLASAATVFYFLHFPLPIAVGFFLWLRRRRVYYDFVAALILLAMAGFATYVLLPVAPPWWAAEHGYLPGPDGMPAIVYLKEQGFDQLASLFGFEGHYIYSYTIYDINPNQVAAFPSLHAAFPFLGFLFARRAFGRVGWLLLAYSVCVWLSIVYLADHYVVDIIGGLLYASAAYWAVIHAPAWFRRVIDDAADDELEAGVEAADAGDAGALARLGRHVRWSVVGQGLVVAALGAARGVLDEHDRRARWRDDGPLPRPVAGDARRRLAGRRRPAQPVDGGPGARAPPAGDAGPRSGSTTRPVGAIGPGLVVLLGVGPDDDAVVADALARKVAELRIFADDEGRTNRSLLDVGGEALVVSQFTLFADTSRGRRPGFTGAAIPDLAIPLYERFAGALEAMGVTVARGRFGAEMAVELVNDGPFTIWLDTDDRA